MRTSKQIAEDLHGQLDDFTQSLGLLPLMEECVRRGMIASRANADELMTAMRNYLSEFNTQDDGQQSRPSVGSHPQSPSSQLPASK